MPDPTTDRLDFISSLRGFAALAVAVVHLRYATVPAATVPAWLDPYVGFGAQGVPLFFIISAFTLCLSGDRRQHEQLPLASFYLRRFFRIAPLFYAWVLISLARDAYFFGQYYTWQKVLLSLTFSFNLWPSEQSGIAWASWTIGIEMLFYVVFPFFYARTRTVKSAAVTLALSFVLSELWEVAFLHYMGHELPARSALQMSFLNMLPIFLMGVLAYRIYERLKQVGQQQPTVLGAVLLLFGIVGICLCAYARAKMGGFQYLTAFTIAVFVIGMGLLATHLSLRAIVNPLTIFLGEISYSFYLAHTTACNVVQHLIEPIYAVLPKLPAFIVLYAIMAAVTVAASYVTYKLIERPGENLGRRIIQRMRDRLAVIPKPPTTATA